MNRYEFLIRFSMVNGQKLIKFKQCQMPLDEDFDEKPLLQQLNFDALQLQQFYHQDIANVLDWLNQDNHFLISYHDKHYPALLKQINSPPLMLFVLGNPNLLNTPQIAMVGSRKFSEYGAQGVILPVN